MARLIAAVAAPSNLGLRPPQPGSVPGTAKAPEALRAAGLLARLGAVDAGLVLPGRYVDDDATRPAALLRNEAAILAFSGRLAAHLAPLLDAGAFPLVLGGDCSILLGAGLAARGRAGTGLLHIDGHTDFRHPGNSDDCASLAGEDLAAAVGLHRPSVADVDGGGPCFAPGRTAHLGCRDGDEHLAETIGEVAAVVRASEVLRAGPDAAARTLRDAIGVDRYWLQVDVDVLDPAVMPAVDSPDAGGLAAADLVALLRALAPDAIGMSVTVYDPDLDPDGRCAALLVDVLSEGLAPLGGAV